LVIFWQKNIGKKAAHKMLMKLTKAIIPLSNISAFLSGRSDYTRE
jgi:hypothetical protein